jgi:plasmid stability protein
MMASIDLPTNIFEVLEDRAAKSQSSLEDAVIEVLKGALAAELSAGHERSVNSRRAPVIAFSSP